MTGDQPAGPYYVILDVAIRDVERYLTYMARVTPALEAAGGRYLARGGELTTYEGDWYPPRIVLRGDQPIRDEVSTGRMIGVEGLPPGVPAAAAPRPRAVPGPPT